MKILLAFSILFSGFVSAGEVEINWLCTEEASQRRGNDILSCGIGQGADENEARTRAFENAKAEFTRVCETSHDCKDHLISVAPQRTVCRSEARKDYKCYRLVAFSIGTLTSSSKIISKREGSQRVKANPNQYPALIDRPDQFQPFVYENTLNLPKVRRGMTKRELLAAFGAPESVREREFQDHEKVLSFMYSGTMCNYDQVCFVALRGNTVESYAKFKPIYTEDLR